MSDSESPIESQQAFSLRPATFADLTEIHRIENRFQKPPWSVEHFQKELDKPYSHFLILTDDKTDSEIAGFIVFWSLMDEVHILNLAVDLPFRGLGYGQRMVRKAISMAYSQNLFRIVLEVRKSNLPAIHLYQKIGFEIVGVRKNLYSDGPKFEDAYQMTIGIKT